DLGHTPFGHAGEDALNEMMAEDGGFEHNLQSLRVVTILEDRYPNFRGLNLSFEVREGIVKHSSYFDNPDHQRFSEYHPEWQPTLEAQLINLTDAIAYLNHDIDDGLESGILKWEELDELAIWRQVKEAVKKKYGESIRPHHMKSMAVSHLISFYINDLAEATRRNLTEVGVETLDDVRQAGRLLVTHTAEGKELQAQVRHHLSERLYQHHRLEMLRFQAHRTIQRLFEAYDSFPTMLPPSYRELNEKYGKRRAIADYIASMTDRYALQEYGRLFESPFPSS
ncbi:deoxyguanosinetriphosphate triphosphohydrolase, partial [bacterium]|nr:deoxyguanosinetriphosphate triphosphohydrolase [bacterium]